MSLKICFLAPSSYGKSTASKILSDIYNVKIVKIATPLYEMQESFYDKLGINIGDRQDGELLQFLGAKVRKEKAMYLLERFSSEVSKVEGADIIINDDCRPYDYEYLKSLGFIFVKINGFKRDRLDYREADTSSKLEWQSEIPYDYQINNFGDINQYRKELENLMEVIKSDRQVLYYSCRKEV